MSGNDFKLGIRSLCRSPGFSTLAVLTLRIGIAAAASVFSLTYHVLFKPLPYPQPGQLVRILERSDRYPMFPVSPGNFVDYRKELSSFQSMGAFTRQDMLLSDPSRPRRLSTLRVTQGYFDTLGYQPALGRVFRREEETRDSRVVILSHRLWQDHFDGEDILGKTIRLSSEQWTVIGVMPQGLMHTGGSYRSMAHGETVDVWIPFDLAEAAQSRNQHYINVIARLQNERTTEQAAEESAALSAQLAEQYPDSNGAWSIRLIPLKQELVGEQTSVLLLLLTSSLLLLLVASLNVANLLLARATSRTRELAVMRALGAGRKQVIDRIASESILLSALAGLLGILFAFAGTRLLVAFIPPEFPRIHAISVDWRVLLYTILISTSAALLMSILPAIQASRTPLVAALNSSAARTTDSQPVLKIRSGLIVAEVAVATALLFFGGLLFRSFEELKAENHGFQTDNVLTFELLLPSQAYDQQARARFFRNFLAEVREIPGVQGAGAATDLPWSGWDENSGLTIVGKTFPPGEGPGARYHAATPGYFESLGIPLIDGRMLSVRDDDRAPGALIVNQAFADTYLPGEPAVGRKVRLWGREAAISGVVGSVKDSPEEERSQPAFWWPFAQRSHWDLMAVTVRTEAEPLSCVPQVRSILQRLDPELPMANVQAMDDIASRVFAERRFSLLLIVLFSCSAIILAAIGVYAMISYSVELRWRELGVRMALGATARNLVRLVWSEGLRLGTLGAVLGMSFAVFAGFQLRDMLFRISWSDPATLLLVLAGVLAVVSFSTVVPAMRAGTMDPADALRGD
jgi:putative ABC transport system permease protein